MTFFGQDADAYLLAKFLPVLERRTIVDVGGAQGDFARAMLRAGAERIDVIETNPRNIEFLGERFRDEPRVAVHGQPLDDHRGVVSQASPEATALASLVEGPASLAHHVGVLKLSVGSDVGRVLSLRELRCDVLVANQWPQHTDMLAVAAAEGFTQFAFVVSEEDFTIVQWNDDGVSEDSSGTLVFLHDSVAAHLLPALLEGVSEMGQATLNQAARMRADAKELARERDIRAAAVVEISRERDIQAAAAIERLALIQKLEPAVPRRKRAKLMAQRSPTSTQIND